MLQIPEVRCYGDLVRLDLDLHLSLLIGRQRDEVAEVLHAVGDVTEKLDGRHVHTHLGQTHRQTFCIYNWDNILSKIILLHAFIMSIS